MKEETLFNLIKLYYENIEAFKSKCMTIDGLIAQYIRLNEDYILRKK